MPRAPIPTYRLHKPTGQAVVTIRVGGKRRDTYLGKYDSPESRAEYARVIAELAASPAATVVVKADGGPTVNEVMLAFLRHGETHYRHPDGRPTGELDNYKKAFRVLKPLYGHTPAAAFGPLALKAVRERMVATGWCRTQVNGRVNRIRRMFRWAASEELVPAPVVTALATVSGLQAGRTAAKEREPVRPVADADVAATLPHLPRYVAGLVRFQQLTGCRPGEACGLRMRDVDATGDVWLYRPARHKTAYRNRPRLIAVGPSARALLAEFPTADPTGYVFSPATGREERYEALRSARRSKVQPSQLDRKKPTPDRRPAAAYTTASYSRAVARGVERANARREALAGAGNFDPVPHWHPNQLRHGFATKVRKRHGLEAAQVLLGHATADVTQVYCERDLALAARVATKIG